MKTAAIALATLIALAATPCSAQEGLCPALKSLAATLASKDIKSLKGAGAIDAQAVSSGVRMSWHALVSLPGMRDCTITDRDKKYEWREYDCRLYMSSSAELAAKDSEIEATVRTCFPGGKFDSSIRTIHNYGVNGRSVFDPFEFVIATSDNDTLNLHALYLTMRVMPCDDPGSATSVLCGYTEPPHTAEVLSGPLADDPFYLASMFCPAGSEVLPQHRFTDVYGDIFAKQTDIRASDDQFLRPCKPDPAADSKRQRWLAEVFRTAANLPAACPSGSVPADGRLMSSKTNQRLLSLFATTWGGDFNTTFALPDLTLKAGQRGGIFCIVTDGPLPQRQ